MVPQRALPANYRVVAIPEIGGQGAELGQLRSQESVRRHDCPPPLQIAG